MKVLIADRFETSGVESLHLAGCEPVVEPALDGDDLCEAIRRERPVVLIVRSTRVTASMLEATDSLSVVVRAGAGVNTIDVDAASRRSVLVANCPGKNAVAVAELTFALMLALDRRIVDAANDLRRGVWNKKRYAEAAGLKGRTLGIIGMGQIGKAVAKRARAFGMDVLAWSRSLTEEAAERMGVIPCGSPANVASECNILSVHLAASPETKGIIGADVLACLAKGSYVINTARADVMDYVALAKAVEDRDLRVGLDVYPDEPSTGEGAFVDAVVQGGGVVYGTHHIGASTQQAQEAIAEETVRIVTKYKRTGQVDNCVNIAAASPARYVLVVRHRNRPGVLAHTLNLISHAGVNVGEMQNLICAGEESAAAQIKLDAPLTTDVLAAIQSGNEHVFAVAFSPIKEP